MGRCERKALCSPTSNMLCTLGLSSARCKALAMAPKSTAPAASVAGNALREELTPSDAGGSVSAHTASFRRASEELRFCALIDVNTGRVRLILPVYSTYTDRASDGFCACGVLALASSVVASIVISRS